MVAPINYAIDVASPFEQAVGGLKLGATVAEIQAKQVEAQRAEQARMAAAAEQQRFMSLENPTIQDVMRYSAFIAPEQAKNLTSQFEMLDKEQQQSMLQFGGQVLSSAAAGKPEVTVQLLLDRAAAERNPQNAQAYERAARLVEFSPANAIKIVGPIVAALPGGDKLLDSIAKTQEQQAGRTISSAEDKKAFGLTDNDGKPLPGTFFLDPKTGKPELVKGEEKPDPGFRVLSPEEAGKRGLPTSAGFTWQVNDKTNQISSLTQPERAAVQVTIPGQPAPLTPYEKARDEKVAPIAVDWMTGERAKATARITQLNQVIAALEKPGSKVSGPIAGLTPDVVNVFINPGSRNARAEAERVIQEGLRATLGPQFTQKEGEALLARSYDPKAAPAENARRLKLIVNQMKEAAKDKDDLVRYLEGPGKGSARGYTGRVPTIGDFYSAIGETAPSGTPTPAPGQPAAASPLSNLTDSELLRQLNANVPGRR